MQGFPIICSRWHGTRELGNNNKNNNQERIDQSTNSLNVLCHDEQCLLSSNAQHFHTASLRAS